MIEGTTMPPNLILDLPRNTVNNTEFLGTLYTLNVLQICQ